MHQLQFPVTEEGEASVLIEYYLVNTSMPVTSVGSCDLVFTHHPTESDQWIVGASGDQQAVREVLLIVQDKVGKS